MERRDFLSNGLLASAGAMAIPVIGCAPTLRQSPITPLSDAEADAILARLDRVLPVARDARPVRDALLQTHPGALAGLGDRVDRADELASAALTGLAIGDAGGMIPEGKAPNERLQARFAELAPALDAQVIGCTALLARMPARERLRLDEAFRRNPDAPMRIGEALDAQAATAGVTAAGRGKLRRIVSQMSARARVQPLSVQLDECVEKVHRVAALHGHDVMLAREVAAHAAVGSLYAHQPAAPPPPPARSEREPPPPLSAPLTGPVAPRRGTSTMTAGGIMLGVGGAVWALGWGAGFGSGGGVGALVIIGTLGAIVAVAGLITLIVGLALYASS